MARPKLDPTERKTEQINLRLSPVELSTLARKADAAGTTVTAFTRSAALGKTVKAPPQSSVDFETRQELRRIGVNLNQIAKHLNAGRAVPVDVIAQTCTKLDSLFDRIMPDGSESRAFRP